MRHRSNPRIAILLSLVPALASLTGCGDDGAPTDAGDAAPDAADSAVDSGRDTGVACDPVCSSIEACCVDDGAPMCRNVVDDPLNCGGCDIACADGRGSSCESGSCVCGRIADGCLGTEESFCCPPRPDGETEYCADLMNGSRDCGGCNAECQPEQSSACVAGECLCGDETSACAGTPEDMCCADGVGDFACHDTTTDVLHCGACGARCQTGERCEAGTCARGDSCAAPCGTNEICCNGTCCTRLLCGRGEC